MKKSLLAALAATCLVLTGCSNGPLPGEAVANAATLAEDQGSAKVAMEMSMNMGGQPFEIVGEGGIDFANKTGQMTMTPQDLPEGAGAMLGSIDMVFAGTVFYMRMDGMSGYLPQGKEWIKVDMQALGEDAGIDFQQLQGLGQDPSQQLDYLRGVSDVEEVGTEEVRGVETTHYKGTVDLDKVVEQHPEAKEGIERIRKLTGLESMPVEVWIDGDGLPRRMSQKMTMQPETSQTTGPVSMDFLMEFFDYGTEIEVEIPDESTVIDPSQLQG
jgi:hypothetical protein